MNPLPPRSICAICDICHQPIRLGDDVTVVGKDGIDLTHAECAANLAQPVKK